MFDEGFFNRFRKSFDRVLFGYDLALAVVSTITLYLLIGRDLGAFDATILVNQATSLSFNLVAIIIAGIAILVSLSNSEALRALKERKLYERFLFTFEFTAMLALLVSIVGIIISSFGIQVWLFYGFIGLFVYMVLATATVISRLITYGDKMAQIVVIESLPEDLGERIQDKSEDSDSGNQANSIDPQVDQD